VKIQKESTFSTLRAIEKSAILPHIAGLIVMMAIIIDRLMRENCHLSIFMLQVAHISDDLPAHEILLQQKHHMSQKVILE